MVEIKNYEEKYREDVHEICLHTANPFLNSSEKTRQFLYLMFADYYIEQEPENVFLLVDENDKAQGYILCAQDFAAYKQGFAPYAKRIKKLGLFFSVIVAVEMKDHGEFGGEYPAHLHIDINDGFRGNGNGSRLIEALCSKLKEKGVGGLMLVVSEKNTGARRFYEKNGFVTLKKGSGIAMGRKL